MLYSVIFNEFTAKLNSCVTHCRAPRVEQAMHSLCRFCTAETHESFESLKVRRNREFIFNLGGIPKLIRNSFPHNLRKMEH